MGTFFLMGWCARVLTAALEMIDTVYQKHTVVVLFISGAVQTKSPTQTVNVRNAFISTAGSEAQNHFPVALGKAGAYGLGGGRGASLFAPLQI